MAIRYERPRHWIRYDAATVLQALIEAKAGLLALAEFPYQRSWADELQQIQLKREVAGTSRIEGAEFTERELDAAMRDTPAQLETRSQRQAAAAVATYRWIATIPSDRQVDRLLIEEVHRKLVTGCDDDHCPPGRLRARDENVTFGAPRHRGVEGGEPCEQAMADLVEALRSSYREHDAIVQALALHYHVAALHPFLDGNGRTARALEALMLRRTGLRDTLFIAMSNYYYEHKSEYLQALADVRAADHDLTRFLAFALEGVKTQCRRLLAEVRTQVSKALFRQTANDLFARLQSPRKRVMSARHLQLIQLLLEADEIELVPLTTRTRHLYMLKNPGKALSRDLMYLYGLGAVRIQRREDDEVWLSADLAWPTRITETEFFRLARTLPRGKVSGS